MCGNIAEISKWDLMYTTGPSKFSLSDILNTLFEEEHLPPSITKPYFSTGFLCKVCKDFVRDLDQLQHEIVSMKKSIISRLKKAKHPEKKKKEAMDSHPDARNVYNIESLKEKKGNNFLVKWENYPEEENTWEPRTSIPSFILKVFVSFKFLLIVWIITFNCIFQFYETDSKRLGTPAPSLPPVGENKLFT